MITDRPVHMVIRECGITVHIFTLRGAYFLKPRQRQRPHLALLAFRTRGRMNRCEKVLHVNLFDWSHVIKLLTSRLSSAPVSHLPFVPLWTVYASMYQNRIIKPRVKIAWRLAVFWKSGFSALARPGSTRLVSSPGLNLVGPHWYSGRRLDDHLRLIHA